MSIKERLQADLKEAMKHGDSVLRDCVRLLNAAIKQVEVDTRTSLDDSGVLKILKSAYKQREDSANSYKEGGREDLYQQECKEMEIIARYLPQQLSDDELKQALREIITRIGASGVKDLGQVMKEAQLLSDVADGRRISTMAKTVLQEL